ncbi:Retrovirus-related Pol polyprotein from transposon [Podosphaera aphanis]|nr:Retrovirus-related Pol polyprotein from transposon [Podosphaera aphanis]
MGYTNSNKIFRVYIPSQQKVIESSTVKFAPKDSGEVTINFGIRNDTQKDQNNIEIYPHQDDQQTTTETQENIPESNNHEREISNQLLTEILWQQPDPSDHQDEISDLPGAFLESPKPEGRPKRSSKPIKRLGSPVSHGPTLRTREEHDHDLGRLVKVENLQNEVECYAIALAAHVASEINKEPKTISEALSGLEKNHWENAIKKELQSLAQNHTWDEVPRPQNRNVVGSKWIFKIKRNADGSVERYKARLVAQGFSQLPGHDFDETFAPVARYDSLRILLRIASQHHWTPQQMDVNSAYLYGTLKEEIYMELPPGLRTPEKCVMLKKCIYGLKQSGREWYSCISNSLQQKNFEIATFDPCVFIHPTEKIFIAIYVDDILIFGPNNNFRENLKTSIRKDFECKDLGIANYILGLEIKLDQKGIRLSQQGYSKRILERFGFNDAHKISTPLDPNITLYKGIEEERLKNVKEYQAIVGSLMYLVIGSRPDLAYTVTLLSQFSSCPNETHLRAAKRTLRYLAGTTNWDLLYPFESSKTLQVFADASYADDPHTRRSTSGYVLRLGEATISWNSKQQRSVALSTTEAEYMAMPLAARQIAWTKCGLEQLHQNYDTLLYADNDGAKELVKNPRIHNRSKHIDVHYHFVREKYNSGEFKLLRVNSANNLADIMTKPLVKQIHHRLSEHIKCARRGEVLENA